MASHISEEKLQVEVIPGEIEFVSRVWLVQNIKNESLGANLNIHNWSKYKNVRIFSHKIKIF